MSLHTIIVGVICTDWEDTSDGLLSTTKKRYVITRGFTSDTENMVLDRNTTPMISNVEVFHNGFRMGNVEFIKEGFFMKVGTPSEAYGLLKSEVLKKYPDTDTQQFASDYSRIFNVQLNAELVTDLI